jgi:hypothetical protein
MLTDSEQRRADSERLQKEAMVWLREPLDNGVWFCDLGLMHMPSFEECAMLRVRAMPREDRIEVVCRLWDRPADMSRVDEPIDALRRLRPIAPTLVERVRPLAKPSLARLLRDLAEIHLPLHYETSSATLDGTPVKLQTRNVTVTWNCCSQIELGPITPRLNAWFEHAWKTLFVDPRAD